MKIDNSEPDYFLDITKEVCPITFVKVRLQIEKMSPNEILEVLLQGEESFKSVPNSVRELGHTILAMNLDPLSDEASPPIYRILIKTQAKNSCHKA